MTILWISYLEMGSGWGRWKTLCQYIDFISRSSLNSVQVFVHKALIWLICRIICCGMSWGSQK